MSKEISFKPSGFPSVMPFLFIKNAAAAIDFYKTAFGAQELAKLEMPDGKIAYAIKTQVLLLAKN